jgi:hypothetical protein
MMLLLGLVATAVAGKVDPMYQHGELAIRGYDPVAYYQQSAPVKGSSQFSFQWRDLALRERGEPGPVSGGARTLRAAVRRVLHICGQQRPNSVD